MKVLIASDNHRDEVALEDLLYIYKEEIDLWLHCGDSEFGLSHPLWDTYKTVKGNMDWENKFPLVRFEQANETVFGILHGHKHKVKQSLDWMAEVAEQGQASIIFYGHTHVAKVDEKDGIYFINPGSITQPRGELRVGSYAIYEETKEGRWIRFFDWNHKEILELSQKLI